MKLTASILASLVVSAVAIATPMTDYRAGVDFTMQLLGADGTISYLGTTDPFSVDGGNQAQITKAAGSLDGSANLLVLAPALGLDATALMKGTDRGNNLIKWDITAPSAIGKTVIFTVDSVDYPIKITGITGTFNADLVNDAPVADPFTGTLRNVKIVKRETEANTLTVKGNLNGSIFFPVVAAFTTVNYNGIAGFATGTVVSGILRETGIDTPLAGRKLEIQLRTPGGTTALQTVTVTTITGGAYSFQTALTGTYDILAKPRYGLRARLASVPISGSSVTDQNFTCINGDIDGDNETTIIDYSIFSDYYDKTSAGSDWLTVGSNGFAPVDADVDGDGAVTIVDYSIFSDSYDQIGIS